MLGTRRREIAALAARERQALARADAASARLRRAKARFLANPLNLLLPFTAGTLGGALALHRKPATARQERRREGIAWGSLLKTATTLWGLSLPFREALLDARLADARAAEDTASDSDASASRPDAAARPGETRSPRPDAKRSTVPRQPAPPA